MELTKGFVQHCNKPSILREFLLQAMEQNEKLEAENASLNKEINQWTQSAANRPIVIGKLREHITELDNELSALKEERRWRQIPNEKPTEDTKFLVINEKGMLQCCYYSTILKEFQIPVTHWMPLPKAPEAK